MCPVPLASASLGGVNDAEGARTFLFFYGDIFFSLINSSLILSTRGDDEETTQSFFCLCFNSGDDECEVVSDVCMHTAIFMSFFIVCLILTGFSC